MPLSQSSGDQVLVDSLRVLLRRDLGSLDAQIAAYPDDESLWQIAPGIANSAGNLALHLAGNLRHYVGARLGGREYVRDRAAEFSQSGLSREELRREIARTMEDVDAGLDSIAASAMNEVYPLPIAEQSVRTGEFLLHLAVHLTYHLGQIDYHRRLLTVNPIPVDNVSVKALRPV
jgi:uncharacterized damage-inducible protein DinB